MFSTANFSKVVVLVVLAAFGAALAKPVVFTDDEMARKAVNRGGRHALDDEQTQSRYVLTTDYGVNWSLGQAGDLTTFAPNTGSFPDFSAVVTSGGQLCYVITLATAATPGVYSMTGPNFTPVLVMAEGNNTFGFGYGGVPGHSEISRAPDGSLICTIWGSNDTDANTLWAVKSTNSGTSWGAPWVVLTEPALPANDVDMGYFKMPERCHSQYAFVQYQVPSDNGFDMYVVRFSHNPPAAGTTTMVDYSGHAFSFMFGGCRPIAYDQTANVLYFCFRNHDANGALIYYSDDAGATYEQQANVLLSTLRYPSMCVRPATETPILVTGETVGSHQPGEQQCLYWSYDEIGYNGGSWIDAATTVCATLFDEDAAGYNSNYVPQAWWWDATRGVQKFDGYTNFLSGEIIRTARTADGGATWTDYGTRMHYRDNQFNAGTMQISKLVGGDNGVAYVIFCAAEGITDEEAPVVNQTQLLTPPTNSQPYVVRAFYDDNVGLDTVGISNGPWVNWRVPGGTDDALTEDSVQLTAPERQSGWYYFTMPEAGITWHTGDSIYFYCDGNDLSGNYGRDNDHILIVGVEWLDISTPAHGTPRDFKLYGNFPNPFNPSTEIRFDLPADSRVDLIVYNSLGQAVRTVLDNERMGAGTHQIYFDAAALPSGLYFYRLSAGGAAQTAKMVLMK